MFVARDTRCAAYTPVVPREDSDVGFQARALSSCLGVAVEPVPLSLVTPFTGSAVVASPSYA